MHRCEICQHEDFSVISTRIREGEGRIVKCTNCGLVMQDIDWDNHKLQEYYKDEYQLTNSLVTGKKQTAAEHFNDRLKTIGSVFSHIEHLLMPESNVLEVGCGAGELISLIRPKVTKCVGVELNTSFVEFIRERIGIEAYDEDINKLSLCDEYDLVISIATLDHLPNPLETLLTMKRLLKKSGNIYVEVPNLNEALNWSLPDDNSVRYREFFWHRAHLYYFSEETIAALFEKAGLKISVTCRHEYTLKNFLKWYFLGRPQSDFVTGLTDTHFFGGQSDFENRMNAMFNEMENRFKRIMAETFAGDNLCCIGSIL